MEVHDAVEGVVTILEVHPPAQSPEVVAQVHGPCGLDPGQDRFGLRGIGLIVMVLAVHDKEGT
jgi:hypothetical protein